MAVCVYKELFTKNNKVRSQMKSGKVDVNLLLDSMDRSLQKLVQQVVVERVPRAVEVVGTWPTVLFAWVPDPEAGP